MTETPPDQPHQPDQSDVDGRQGDTDRASLWRAGPVLSASGRPLARYLARPLREFLRIESASSFLLLGAAVTALVWANSGWSSSYEDLWHLRLDLRLGSFELGGTLHHWVNDALMVVFFFVVGLEIKYELASGELRDPRAAALPIVAAAGGMVVPAGIYALVAAGGDGAAGWGIPMATDIAFAVGVLGVLGRRIPSAARLFLLTLAIVDDIGAIIVIAVFYTDDLDLVWLAVAAGLVAVVVGMRLLRVWAIPAYLVVGVGIWYAVLESGVHATIAGVVLGLLTPAGALLDEEVARRHAQEALADNLLDPDEVHRLRFLVAESVPVVERLQHHLHPLSAYVVLPVFALANAGVHLGTDAFDAGASTAVALGVAAGLVIGKPLGIFLACQVAVRTRLARLPDGVGWSQLAGIGAVAGIGFTVSLFIAGLSFDDPALTEAAKLGTLGGSLVAAVVGIGLLVSLQGGARGDRFPRDVAE
ncbi:Na+/H+ antiporter NhaA [Nocardioides sp. MH1]|uniref:Na+/H+ antiporter NhaA n=1 Tax=Nocardioides sp. MH1 TaxID=3242490 RepID=UPI003522B78B